MKKILKKFNLFNGRILFLLPYIIYSIIFIVVPLFLILITAFIPVDPNVDFNNFSEVQFSGFWTIMGRSIWLGLLSAVISLIIGLPFVYIVARSKSKIFRIISLNFTLSPFFIFTLVKIFSIKGLFLFIFDSSVLNNNAFLLFGLVYVYLPFIIIPIYTIIRDMPKNIIDASSDLGFPTWKTFLKIVIPYSIKAILNGVGIVFLLSATSVGISAKLLPNPSQNQLIGNVINDLAVPANPFSLALVSNVVIVTLIIMSIVYFAIYVIPILILRKKGFKNV